MANAEMDPDRRRQEENDEDVVGQGETDDELEDADELEDEDEGEDVELED